MASSRNDKLRKTQRWVQIPIAHYALRNYNYLTTHRRGGETQVILKQIRTDRGIKQRELANLLNTSCATVSRWESGVNEPRDDATLIKLSGILGVSVDELLGVKGNPISAPESGGQ
ncbi:MAG: XRE family transcriptional regulator [Clostridia bacterium]|nr:XRE family transcriptional regulator [Clostridia bacterium]